MRLISRTTCSPTPGILHCRAPHNPIGYVGAGGLDWIDLGRIDDVVTGAGASKINTASVVSVGRRQDGAAEKFIGLRPDFRQDGTEQMEWSFEGAEFDGLDGKVKATDIAVWRHRQRCRMLVEPTKDCRSFRIVFRLHLTGLRVEERYGEFWLYSTIDGGFRWRISEPAVCDPLTQEPVRDRDGNPTTGLVRHSLVKDGDTWLYVKDSTEAFTRAVTDGLLPAGWLIDADTYYATTSDGYIYAANANWDTVHDASSGTRNNFATTYTAAMRAGLEAGNYYITRSFFYFSTEPVTYVEEASLKIYGYSDNASKVSSFQGTQADLLATADFASFSGAEWGHTSSWSKTGYNTLPVPAASVNVAGTTKICCREYDHDVLDSAPSAAWYNGCYYANQSGTTYDPYLSITEGEPPYVPRLIIVS